MELSRAEKFRAWLKVSAYAISGLAFLLVALLVGVMVG